MNIKNWVLGQNTSTITHQETVEAEGSGIDQRMGNSAANDNELSMTILEPDDEDDDKIVTIGHFKPNKKLSTSPSDHSLSKQDQD